MRVAFCVVLAAFVTATSAAADGYSALNAGIAARTHGEADVAVQQLTLAINAPDLPPRFLSVARYDRASAYMALGQYTNALTDLDAAISLRPNRYAALMLRAIAHRVMKDNAKALRDAQAAVALRPELASAHDVLAGIHLAQNNIDAAIADASDAVALDPESAGPLSGRATIFQLAGRYDLALADLEAAKDLSTAPHSFDLRIGIAQWLLGKSRDALSNFDSAQSNEPQSLYPLIWKAIAQLAMPDALAELTKSAANRDVTKWPGPIVSLFAGKATETDVKTAAGKDDGATLLQGRRCEADVYLSEWRLLHHDSAGVREMLASAVDECPEDFVELPVAKFELNHLAEQSHA